MKPIRRMEASHGHEHVEVLLGSAYAMAENRELRACGFSEDQRLNNVDKLVNEMITSYVQALVVVESDQEVKFNQEASITDVKFTRQGKSCGELRSVGGSNNVSKESPMKDFLNGVRYYVESCGQISEMVPETQRLPDAYRGDRLRQRELEVS